MGGCIGGNIDTECVSCDDRPLSETEIEKDLFLVWPG